MFVKFILPADGGHQPAVPPSQILPVSATRAGDPGRLAGEGRRAEMADEHVERLHLDDVPDFVVIQVYITCCPPLLRDRRPLSEPRRVCMPGRTPRNLPARRGRASTRTRSLSVPVRTRGRAFWPTSAWGSGRALRIDGSVPWSAFRAIRRDLIRRRRYLVPNSIVVSRGCPHDCDFCYKEAFFQGGRPFYTQAVDDALAEIERLPGRHLYFLDDHLFGNRRFPTALIRWHEAAWAGCGRRRAR